LGREVMACGCGAVWCCGGMRVLLSSIATCCPIW
jgi:hypothetical protein